MLCVLAKNRKNRKVDDFSRSLAIFCSSYLVNDIGRKRVADFTKFAKIARNQKVDDFTRLLAIFRSSLSR